MKVGIISLGCPKNLIDSEVAAGHLAEGGFELTLDPAEAEIMVVNTCGFIEPARDESLGVIEDLSEARKRGALDALVVMGCLVQRDRDALAAAFPEVDAFLPISDYSGLPSVIEWILDNRRDPKRTARPPMDGGVPKTEETDLGRCLLTLPHVSYLRIAEGCDHRCSYCAIPDIRGPLRSRPLDVLVGEAEALAAAGVKELALVAEDTTVYGRKLPEGHEGDAYGLPELLEALDRVEGLAWIRVLYAYPTGVSDRLIEVMARSKKVVEYLDLPIQHIHPRILKSMGRGATTKRIEDAVDRLRGGVRDIALRTSVIVGYPGETEAEFEALLEFLERVRFERLGAFAFSPEKGTRAAGLPDPVPADRVAERLDRVMRLEARIIRERNERLVGRDLEVLVDAPGFREGEDVRPGLGRTRADAPEIDCSVLLDPAPGIEAGDLIEARITGFEDYDLKATPSPRRETAKHPARRKRGKARRSRGNRRKGGSKR